MISQSMLQKIRHSRVCKARLQIVLDKAAPTIQRYLDDNDIMLTTKPAVDVIKEEFGVTEEEIFETESKTDER